MSHRLAMESLYKALFLGYAFLLFFFNFPDRYMRWWFCIHILVVVGVGVWTSIWIPEKKRWAKRLALVTQFALILVTLLVTLLATLADWLQGSGVLIRHSLWLVFVLMYYWEALGWARNRFIPRWQPR